MYSQETQKVAMLFYKTEHSLKTFMCTILHLIRREGRREWKLKVNMEANLDSKPAPFIYLSQFFSLLGVEKDFHEVYFIVKCVR